MGAACWPPPPRARSSPWTMAAAARSSAGSRALPPWRLAPDMSLIVDVHSHHTPPDMDSMPDLGGRRPGLYMQDLDRLFRVQDEGGVDVSVLSNPTLVETALPEGRDAVLDAMRRVHDYYAQLVARHPGRLAALAVAWPQGGDAFLREFERAVRELGLRGAIVNP